MKGSGSVNEIPVREGSIRLGQFLKLANVVDGGSDVKALLASGEVTVNGEPETRRGRQLATGDTVDVAGQTFRVAVSAGAG